MASDKQKRHRGTQFAFVYKGISQKSAIEGVAWKTRAFKAEILTLVSCRMEEENEYAVIMKTSKEIYFREEEVFKVGSSIPKVEFITGSEIGLQNYISWARSYKEFVCEKDHQIIREENDVVEAMFKPFIEYTKIDLNTIEHIELKIKVFYKDGKVINFDIMTKDEDIIEK